MDKRKISKQKIMDMVTEWRGNDKNRFTFVLLSVIAIASIYPSLYTSLTRNSPSTSVQRTISPGFIILV